MRTYADPFPVVVTQRQLDDIKPRVWAECAKCADGRLPETPEGDTDYVAWSKEHVRKHPTHDRFRLATSTGYSVPSRPEEGDDDRIP